MIIVGRQAGAGKSVAVEKNWIYDATSWGAVSQDCDSKRWAFDSLRGLGKLLLSLDSDEVVTTMRVLPATLLISKVLHEELCEGLPHSELKYMKLVEDYHEEVRSQVGFLSGDGLECVRREAQEETMS